MLVPLTLLQLRRPGIKSSAADRKVVLGDVGATLVTKRRSLIMAATRLDAAVPSDADKVTLITEATHLINLLGTALLVASGR